MHGNGLFRPWVISTVGRFGRLGLKAVTGPDSAEATEITEWVRTEFTKNYGKLRSSDTEIQRRYLNLNLNLNLNSLLVKRQIDNPSPGAVTGGN